MRLGQEEKKQELQEQRSDRDTSQVLQDCAGPFKEGGFHAE